MTERSPQVAPQRSIDVGEIKVTYLPDGEGVGSPTLMFPASNEDLWAAHPEYLDPDGKWLFSMGGFLIQTGGQNVVVDLGFGDVTAPFPPLDALLQGGRLLDSLKQTGVEAADVDAVIFTHLHLDHVGWTAQGGTLTFPGARHLAGEGEWEFWRGVTDENLAAVGPDPEAVQAPLDGHIEAVGDGGAIAPGVNVMATPGHTPGHISLVISSGVKRAIILGDSLHCPLQLEDAELRLVLDVDPALARRTQERIAAELEGSPQTIAANGHFSDSVFGRVVPATGRRWVSVPGRRL